MAINSREASNCRTAEDHVISRDARNIASKRGMLATGGDASKSKDANVRRDASNGMDGNNSRNASNCRDTSKSIGIPCREPVSARMSARAGSRAA
jgi:hypothetical protein